MRLNEINAVFANGYWNWRISYWGTGPGAKLLGYNPKRRGAKTTTTKNAAKVPSKKTLQMRVGEIAALTIGDVRGLDGKAVSVINLSTHQTKGNRARRVFVSDELRKLLSQYLAALEGVSDARPFIRSTRTGGHFSNVSLSLRFKAIYQAAGIKTSSHSGRRTFATRLNGAGIGMRTVQNALGHASIQTTALYCDVSDDQLANAVNAI